MRHAIRMTGLVIKHKETLGSTGEGIKDAASITDAFPVAFRNKWGKCLSTAGDVCTHICDT